MNKIAFIVPIYPPHFRYAKELINSWIEQDYNKQSDLWFVFTSEEEKEMFGYWRNSIVLPNNSDVKNISKPINIKKLYALNYICEHYNYDYSIMIDSETEFCKRVNLSEICNTYFKTKLLYGNLTTDKGRDLTEQIKASCKKYFNKYKNKKLLDTDYYLWFNQPCIYKMSNVKDFLEKIDYSNNMFKYEWADFDYYLYMYYLILFKDFDIMPIGVDSDYGTMEGNPNSIIIKNYNYKNFDIYICSASLFYIFNNPKLFMIIHTDRDYHWELDKISDKINNYITEDFIDLVPENQPCKKLYQNKTDIDEKIKSKDISVVIQGTVNKIKTSRCIDSIRNILPESEIILSTWEDSDVSDYDYDILVKSVDPGAVKTDIVNNVTNNQNRQLISTREGVKKASRKYILKIRTDFELHNANFLNYWNNFPCRKTSLNIFRHRVIISSIFSREYSDFSHRPVLFHPSDFYIFGYSEDIKNYYNNIRLASDKELGDWQYLYPNKIPYPEAHYRYAPEQFFFFSYVKKFLPYIKFEDWSDWNEDNCKISHDILINNFIFLDYEQSGIYSEKFHNYMTNADFLYGVISFNKFEDLYKEEYDKSYVCEDEEKNFETNVNDVEEIKQKEIKYPNGYEEYQKYNGRLHSNLIEFFEPIKNFSHWIIKPITAIFNLIILIFNPYFIRRSIACFIIDKTKRRNFREDK